MIKLHKDISKERQDFLLNPQNRDKVETFLYHTYGRRLYKISVGYKWVFLRSPSHTQRMRLNKFLELAKSNWIRSAKNDASYQNYLIKGTYKRPRGWEKNYGL